MKTSYSENVTNVTDKIVKQLLTIHTVSAYILHLVQLIFVSIVVIMSRKISLNVLKLTFTKCDTSFSVSIYSSPCVANFYQHSCSYVFKDLLESSKN